MIVSPGRIRHDILNKPAKTDPQLQAIAEIVKQIDTF